MKLGFDMIANYHSHTARCGHASGTERQYVEAAIEAGYKILGFSDHTPYPFEERHVSRIRMRMQELADYCSTVRALKEEYASDITIHLGLEAEYYPKYFDRLKAAAEDEGVEFFLLGQHFTGNEYDGVYAGMPGASEEVLRQYVSQSIEAMETGAYLYFAHPDLICYDDGTDLYKEQMRLLCKAAKRLEIPLEINLLGIWSKRHYPDPVFWEIAAEEGNEAILGMDCHDPEKMYVPEAIEEAENMARRLGLRLLTDLELKLK